ncbi:MAG TPA: class I SAM-dependent methyltransferase [Kofleriaceae bacterium]|jgi:hypothetical protein|nr:class I SAM-dependent methyltransferase [Kofleriaceae bacterium]
MLDRHGLVVAARAGAATLAAGAFAYVLRPSIAPLCAVAGATGVLAFELSRVAKTLAYPLALLETDLGQAEALIALYATLGPRRALPPLRGYAISPDFALVLMQLIDDHRPELVVETGSGVSTLIMAYRLERLGRGTVIALDHDPVFAARTRSELERHGLTAYAKVLDAPLEPLALRGQTYRWHAQRAVADLRDIDLVVDDGPPRELGDWLRYASLPMLAPKLSARGMFVMNMLGAEERTILSRWQDEYPELHQQVFATRKGHAILSRQSSASRSESAPQ